MKKIDIFGVPFKTYAPFIIKIGAVAGVLAAILFIRNNL